MVLSFQAEYKRSLFNLRSEILKFNALFFINAYTTPSRQGKRIQAIFLHQLLKFQSLSQHKIFLTSRSTALQNIAQELPQQLKRIAIEPWDKQELKQWFQQWAKVQSLPISQNFFIFLKQAGVFSAKSKLPEISALVRQPFMLYLLSVLHRDELLHKEILQFTARNQHTRNASLLWEIYHRLSRWLLGYAQTGSIKTMLMRWGVAHIHRTQEAMGTRAGAANASACPLDSAREKRHRRIPSAAQLITTIICFLVSYGNRKS
ncbi:pentapeptide repeat-containing protein [Scytonema sp. HK-05]|uniref:hypothetical protein n=1 Tax=Scytonema sp. HK-05 TaxID=1137095 RepID=UPI000935896A|nr:hypothetical protein NIES2130_22420 [Scytonema sp. HK-05]BAY45681.1 pentapeptide repeat-containing protein [Scytonema sp. HK-05]